MTPPTGDPDRYGVVGHPVAHSRSPFIHRRFAAATGESLSYERFDVRPGQFAAAVSALADAGIRGLNVTLPHKLDALAFAHRLTDRARDAGAVNTLAWTTRDEVLGDNTDGAGLLRDLIVNLGSRLGGSRIALLGAGGAARGALAALTAVPDDERPVEIVIANRTESKADQLAAAFAARGPVTACGYARLAGPYDLFINATAASLAGDVPPVPAASVHGATLCYDMMYQSGPTPFLEWARAAGAGKCADGTGMLVEQAAESFALWRGVRPETGPVLAALRAALADPAEEADV